MACWLSLVRMEAMQITILSVREQDGQVVARARVGAAEARIWLEVTFVASQCFDTICKQALAETLRYLDPK